MKAIKVHGVTAYQVGGIRVFSKAAAVALKNHREHKASLEAEQAKSLARKEANGKGKK